MPLNTTVLKAHITVLCLALGGPDHLMSPPEYRLGADCWAVLKDLKRWMVAVDRTQNLLEVTRACGETRLVSDLTTILKNSTGDGPAMGQSRAVVAKVRVAAAELLAQLTWRNQQVAGWEVVRRQQVAAKPLLCDQDFLRLVLQLAVPVLATEERARTSRDRGVLGLVVALLRNIADINTLPGETVRAFAATRVLEFLTAVAATATDDSLPWLCLGAVHALVRPMAVLQVWGVRSNPLAGLLAKEAALKKEVLVNSSSRHGRFGTLLALQTDGTQYTVSGTGALSLVPALLAKIDGTKRAKPGTAVVATAKCDTYFAAPASVDDDVYTAVGVFAASFLANAFNPVLAQAVRTLASDDTVDPEDTAAFCSFVSWFVAAAMALKADGDTISNAFAVESLVTLLRAVRVASDARQWDLLHVALATLNQVLAALVRRGDVAAHAAVVRICGDPSAVRLATVVHHAGRTQVFSPMMQATLVDTVYHWRKAVQLFVKKGLPVKDAARSFVHADGVLLHINHLARFRDLSEEQVHRGVRFLAAAFEADKHLLYRVDVAKTLHELVVPGCSTTTWQFVAHFTRNLARELETRPSLFVEMLFGGSAAETEVETLVVANRVVFARPGLTLEERVSICVAALIDRDERAVAEFARSEVANAGINHGGGELVVTGDAGMRRALVRNGVLRLLLETVGARVATEPHAPTVFPEFVTKEELHEAGELIAKYLVTAVELEDGIAEDYLREERETVVVANARGLGKKRAPREVRVVGEEKEKAPKKMPISSMFVEDSSDSENEEAFFAREAALRQMNEAAAAGAMESMVESAVESMVESTVEPTPTPEPTAAPSSPPTPDMAPRKRRRIIDDDE